VEQNPEAITKNTRSPCQLVYLCNVIPRWIIPLIDLVCILHIYCNSNDDTSESLLSQCSKVYKTVDSSSPVNNVQTSKQSGKRMYVRKRSLVHKIKRIDQQRTGRAKISETEKRILASRDRVVKRCQTPSHQCHSAESNQRLRSMCILECQGAANHHSAGNLLCSEGERKANST